MTTSLSEEERADIVADLELTKTIRSQYRARLHTLRKAGRATESNVAKLELQIEACSRWIRHYEEQLA